jgi:two-component system, NtrC family, nitrogen regulation sensor histidine kinase NtrY
MMETSRSPGNGVSSPESAVGAPLPLPQRAAWAGAAVALLSLARWLAHLGVFWLIVACVAATVWTVVALRRPRGWRTVATLFLWLAVGVAAVVQYRLVQVATAWETVARDVEERAASGLHDALDEIFDRGVRAVESVEGSAALWGRRAPDAAIFDELERLRRTERMSAVAVYDADGLPLAWAGEHRGMIPEPVRRGERIASFYDGPLFQYVYFTRSIGRGQTAVAALMLNSTVEVAGPYPPFAEQFTRSYGIEPRFTAPDRARGEALWDWTTAQGPILSVSFGALTQERWWERRAMQGRWTVVVLWTATWVLLVLVWYRRRVGPPSVPVALTTVALLSMPIGSLTGAEALFSPMRFLMPVPGTVTLGETLIVLVGAAVYLLALSSPGSRGRTVPVLVAVLLAAVLFPLVLWLLDTAAAPGLFADRDGGGFALQIAAMLMLALPLYVLLNLAEGRLPELGAKVVWLGLLLASLMGVGVLLAWSPEREVPRVVAALWVMPFLLVALGRARWRGMGRVIGTWLAIGWVAGSLVLPMLWNRHVEVRLELAEEELERLGTEPDAFIDFLLRQFAESALELAADGERGVNLLYRAWVASGLAAEGEEARITSWNAGVPEAELRLSDVEPAPALLEGFVADALDADAPVLRRFDQVETVHYLLLVPMSDDRVVSVILPPRRHIGRATALARFLDPSAMPVEDDDRQHLTLVPISSELALLHEHLEGVQWSRNTEGWRSEIDVGYPTGPMHAHLLIRVPSRPLLIGRGLIVMAAALAAFTLLWALARTLCGEPFGLAVDMRRAVTSFRARLTFALLLFFLIPTLAFGAVAYGAVSREVVRTAAALARRTLHDAVSGLTADPVARLHPRMGRDLVLYRHGVLVDAVAPEILDLGLFQTWLPPDVVLTFRRGEDADALEERRVGGSAYLVAYRRINADEVMGAPIALASGEIARRQREFSDIVMLVALLGAALSTGLSLAVGRALSRPIEQLSRAAAAVGAGNLRVRLPESRADEFGGVYRSFNRMVQRLRRTRAALLRETRRTEVIVAEAATGVLALDHAGSVALVNPRAQQILESELHPGEALPEHSPLLRTVVSAVRDFWQAGELERGQEIEVDGRVIRLRLRRMLSADGIQGGAVLALEDITPEIRSARVLAWGEMARQVAHEIKNPLTPIKLSVQHLRRAYADRRPDFERILDSNVESVLREIDRLGEIARAFARFGTPAPDGGKVEPIDVAGVVNETLTLYRGGDDGIEYVARLDPALPRAHAHAGELKEVLVNLFENAREALGGRGRIEVSARPAGGGAWVELDIADAGEGIPAELLARVFEPHFSTRSSGTGLGLAIVRRLVEGWGGEVTAESSPGEGTIVHLRLRSAE